MNGRSHGKAKSIHEIGHGSHGATSIDSGQSPLMKDCMQRLKRLNILHEQNFISDQEWQTRKRQIVDELTDTTLTYRRPSMTMTTMSTFRSRNGSESAYTYTMSPLLPPMGENGNNKVNSLQRLPSHSPDWDKIKSEKALKWVYIYETDSWEQYQLNVKIEETAFNQGRRHYIFHLKDLSCNEHYIAKMSKDAPSNSLNNFEQLYANMTQEYTNNVKMQAIAQHCAQFEGGYNSYKIKNRKNVIFLDTWLLYLVQREGAPICYMQPFVENYNINNNYYTGATYASTLETTNGENNINNINNNNNYIKHQSMDYKNKLLINQTMESFSHFTFKIGKNEFLICNMQYRGEIENDHYLFVKPQIMTINGNHTPFGKGDLGKNGIRNFIRTHQCNEICRQLGLEHIQSYKNSIYYTNDDSQTYANDNSTMIDKKHETNRGTFDEMNAPIIGHHDSKKCKKASDGCCPTCGCSSCKCACCCIL